MGWENIWTRRKEECNTILIQVFEIDKRKEI